MNDSSRGLEGTGRDFIQNAWYVAAWSHEVTADRALARTILGQKLLLYRKADGTVAALEDRCAHRAAPLSLGRIEGDSIRCMYHGVRYGADGHCVEVPGQAFVPPKLRIRSFPTHEKDHFVWIWTGEPIRADPAGIVDIPWQSDAEWVWLPGYLKFNAHYELLVDNLLDLSHLSYVHLSTLGTAATAQQRPKVEKIPGGVRLTYWDLNSDPTPQHARAGMTGKVDRWLIAQWQPPAIFLLDAGSAPTGTGAPEGIRRNAMEFRNTSIQTPETHSTTHYFWAQARNFRIRDDALTRTIHDGVLTAFEEDRVVIEAQQANVRAGSDAGFVKIRVDEGPERARDLIRAALEREVG